MENVGLMVALAGAMTKAPTAEQVSTAVDAWLDDHPEATTTVTDGSITNAKLASSFVTPGTAAAYSSSATYAVGDYVFYGGTMYRCTTDITTAEAWTAAHWTAAVLGDDVSDLNRTIGNVDYKEWADGYFGSDGAIYNASGKAEKYTVNYIPVLAGESLSLTITLSSGEAQWARWVFYDENKNVCGYGMQNQTWTASITIPIPVPKNAFYLRISFRSFNKITVFDLSRTANLITTIDALNKSIPRKISGFRTIAHQGYSATEPTGHNLLEGYALAKEKGFEWGECDLQVSSDGVLVCCHDGTFVDQTSGTTITISEHTAAELQTYNYYGGTIATFEEIVRTCKLNGLGLAIDQITTGNADKVFPIVKKYGMQEHVAYILADNTAYPDLIGVVYNVIKTADANAHIMVISYPENINHTVDFVNANKTDNNIIEMYVNYSSFTYDTGIPALQESLDSRINVGVWTIDWLPTCLEYLPFVSAICSNKISTYDLLA